MFWHYIYLGFVTITGIMCGGLAVFALHYRKDNRAAVYFAVMMFTVAEWLATSLLVCFSRGDHTTLLFIYARYSGLMLMVPYFMLFAIQYSGREKWLTRLNVIILFIFPIISIILTWSNDLHRLMIQSISYAWDGPILYVDTVTYGAYYWVHTIFSYTFVLAGVILLAQMAARSFRLYRQQSILLILGIVPAIGITLIDAFMLIPEFKHAVSPIGFALMGAAFFASVFYHRFLNVVPIARDMLIESMSDGMLVLDEKARIIDVNPAVLASLKMEASQIIGQPIRTALAPWSNVIIPYIDEKQTQAEFTIERDGRHICYDLRISPIVNRHAKTIGRLVVLRDVSPRKRMEEELRANNDLLKAQLDEINHLQIRLHEMVIRDSLTGLFNRRYLDETMQHILSVAEREKSQLSILMIDLDLFKLINDTHGHATGDAVLIALGEHLWKTVRSSDVICRYGGEEFIILMTAAPLEIARERAELIRTSIEKLDIHSGQLTLRVTVSIGVATYPVHGLNFHEIFQAADDAMYAAKIAGRNRVVVAG